MRKMLSVILGNKEKKDTVESLVVLAGIVLFLFAFVLNGCESEPQNKDSSEGLPELPGISETWSFVDITAAAGISIP